MKGEHGMRKYMEVANIYLKSQLFWRADTMINMLFTIGKIIFAYLLWGIIFQDNEFIAGFTFHSMLSYYIISSFLSQLDISEGVSGEISARIRNGTFSKYMVIPVHIERYFISMEVGVILFQLVFDIIASGIWIFVFRIQFVFTNNIGNILSAFIIILLGLLFMIQLNFYLGLLTFKYEEISTFLMIKNNLVALITGGIIPLVLLSETVIRMMKFLPFYYVTYLPSMLLIGRCSKERIQGIAVLLFWCIFMEWLIKRTYDKYRLQYDGVGI